MFLSPHAHGVFLVKMPSSLFPRQTQIRIAVIKLSVIKRQSVFGKTDENCIPSLLFSDDYFCPLLSRLRPLSDGHLRDFISFFFKSRLGCIHYPKIKELSILRRVVAFLSVVVQSHIHCDVHIAPHCRGSKVVQLIIPQANFPTVTAAENEVVFLAC